MADMTLNDMAVVHLAQVRDRFEAKFARSAGCWHWQASTTPGGYGMFKMGALGLMNAHRASWLLYRGMIPDGAHVLHNCPGGDNPACVNPEHLFLGTHQANMDDKVAKGRQARGTAHGLATLDDRRVLEVRAAVAAGISPVLLGRVYGIHRATVHSLGKGEGWRHVTGTLDGDDLEELLAVLREHEAAYRREVSDKCRTGAAVAAATVRSRREAAGVKRCTGECKQELPLSDFYIKDRRTGAPYSRCKKCHTKWCNSKPKKG